MKPKKPDPNDDINRADWWKNGEPEPEFDPAMDGGVLPPGQVDLERPEPDTDDDDCPSEP